jgi:hypothetical protein
MLIDHETSGELRVTIHDDQQTVSFMAGQDLALRLVAGCAVNPLNLEELLLATEVYQRGISARLMGDLMEFDKGWLRQGEAYLKDAFEPGTEAATQPVAFQVVDDLTETAAHEPSEGGLLVIDLFEHRIRITGDLEVPVEGQVLVHTGERLTEQAITYILPKRWEIEKRPK